MHVDVREQRLLYSSQYVFEEHQDLLLHSRGAVRLAQREQRLQYLVLWKKLLINNRKYFDYSYFLLVFIKTYITKYLAKKMLRVHKLFLKEIYYFYILKIFNFQRYLNFLKFEIQHKNVVM